MFGHLAKKRQRTGKNPNNSINNQMNPIDPNEPAFPTAKTSTITSTENNGAFIENGGDPGMTKRELFAMAAMQG